MIGEPLAQAEGEQALRRFKFLSPGSGAYRVRLLGADASNTASMLMAGEDDSSELDLAPGSYLAMIEPIGTGEIIRQSVQLDVESSAPISLHDVPFQERGKSPLDGPGRLEASDGGSRGWEASTWMLTNQRPDSRSSRPIRFNQPDHVFDQDTSDERRFSIGISRRTTEPDRRGRRRWHGGSLPMQLSDRSSGGMALSFRRPHWWRECPEWRLTVAVAEDPRWRMRIPLFAGGVQITFVSAKTSEGPDIVASLAPRDPGRAALLVNLETLLLGSAAEVLKTTLAAFRRSSGEDLIAHMVESGEDPWTITAAAILLLQAGELEPMSATVVRFAREHTWLPDLTVMLASIAVGDGRQSREHRETSCLRTLQSIPGQPYFAASQSQGLSLLTGLALGGKNEALRHKAGGERERWARLTRRQLRAGAYLATEERRLAASVVLDRRGYDTIASGVVRSARIDVAPPSVPKRQSSCYPPALSRPKIHENDPWKDRFGGSPSRDGFELCAEFQRGPKDWIQVKLSVTGPADAEGGVEMFLHDSFQPDHLHLRIERGMMSYTLLTSGGFTVGAWVEAAGVELELDLSLLDNAPLIIRDL